jgi:SAM-dependent methyltransferase
MSGVTGSWKDRLYEQYVSSGQASSGSGSTTIGVPALLAGRAPYIRHVIEQFVPHERRSRILDLGCGYGAFVYFLVREGYTDVIGVDVSAEQVEIAHRLGLTNVHLAANQVFVDGIANTEFDVILLMDVLEHLTGPQLLELLAGVRRILRPGGICIAHVPNAEGIFGMRVRFGDLTHEWAFTRQSVVQLTNALGFNDVEIVEDRPVVHGLTSLLRRVLWTVLTAHRRLLLLVESGSSGAVLSQNMLFIARR